MTNLTDRLDAIQAQLEAATPGPWAFDGMDAGHSRYEMNWWVTAGDAGDSICDMDGLNRSRNERVAQDDGRADAEFIAAAPESTRFLLNLARKQQAALDAVRALVHDDTLSDGLVMHVINPDAIRAALEARP